MRDEDDGSSGACPQLAQLALQTLPSEGVDGAEGLVHQDDLRVVGQRPGDLAALLHAARQLVGASLGDVGKPDAFELVDGSGPTLRPGHAA